LPDEEKTVTLLRIPPADCGGIYTDEQRMSNEKLANTASQPSFSREPVADAQLVQGVEGGEEGAPTETATQQLAIRSAIRLSSYHCFPCTSVPSVALHVVEFTFLGGFESLPLRHY
jgi:hypothetical protein